MEDAAVDTVEDVESLRSRNPKESSEEAEDVMDGAMGDIPSFGPLYGASTTLRVTSTGTANILTTDVNVNCKPNSSTVTCVDGLKCRRKQIC